MVAIKASDLLPKSTKSSGGDGRGSTGGGGGDSNENISEDWTRFGKKQILSIGKKRHRLQDQHDIEEDDVGVGGEEYNSSSDEEEGRTSAVREKKRRKTKAAPQPVAVATATTSTTKDASADSTDSVSKKKKKEKKKGKKERAKENKAKAEEQLAMRDDPIKTGDAPIETTNITDAGTAAAASTGKLDDTKAENAAGTNDNDNPNKPKRKRKKVRSRQKNIRKDNRTTTEKPSHLVLGSEGYAGRPMTMETRKKLGIADTAVGGDNKTKKKKASSAFDSGEWVGAEKKKISHDAIDTGVATDEPKDLQGSANVTKIGDCLVGDDVGKEIGDAPTSKEDTKEKKKEKKLKKKRKFKNC